MKLIYSKPFEFFQFWKDSQIQTVYLPTFVDVICLDETLVACNPSKSHLADQEQVGNTRSFDNAFYEGCWW